jgi:hypothetical protein
VNATNRRIIRREAIEGMDVGAVIAFSTATDAKCAVLVNGVEQETLSFPNMKSWSRKKTGKLTLALKPGANTVEILNRGKRGINFDYINLKPLK